MKEDAGEIPGRSLEDYQAGLEDSIRRCEELLARTPLTFLPPHRGSGSSVSVRDSSSRCCSCPENDDFPTSSVSERRLSGSGTDSVLHFSSKEKAGDVACSQDAGEIPHSIYPPEGNNNAPAQCIHSLCGDEVELIIETDYKHEVTPRTGDQQKPPLKFCPLEGVPSKKIQRSKSVPKENLQRKNAREFFNAIGEVMDNLKSYIHCPSLQAHNNVTGKERLNNLSKPRTEVYKRLAQVKKIIEDKQLKECSFKPAVRIKSEFCQRAPVLERLTEAQQQKEARRREKIQKAMKEHERYSFKPEINPNSVQLFKQRGLETVDLTDRLNTMGHSVHLDCKNDIETMGATFCPEINSNTDDILASSQQFHGLPTDFLSRQQQFSQSLQKKKKQKENEFPSAFTFTPNIGNSDYILKKTMCFPETCEERVQRLAYKDKANQMQTRKKVADDYYGQFNFQPTIDENFYKAYVRLLQNREGHEVKKELEQAAEFDFQKKCPFRPMTFSSLEGEKPVLRSKFLERLQARKGQYSTSMQESWTTRELAEIKECTFKPSVNRPRPRVEPPKIIKGLERYFELQQIAKQMRKDQENLEKKVFFSHVSSLPIRQYTIPKPFSFTEHYKHDAKPSSLEIQ
ncbi:hypothetical protein SELMODRAFT_430332 [Selaginella moellendorffii]|uniref:Uncharacterized protein n=1 Tax=Selaginella moellendorffii TaxID=88036 RepID=D8T927_SELML|nr:hypothetical protein SELMODRAFT_430332 [Selaginella moellendorffii]